VPHVRLKLHPLTQGEEGLLVLGGSCCDFKNRLDGRVGGVDLLAKDIHAAP